VFLHLKGLSAKVKDVHTEVVQVLGSHAIAYSIVTQYIQKDILLQDESEAEDRVEDQDFSIRDNGILKAPEGMPFASLRQIARMVFIPPTTVFRLLPESLHFAGSNCFGFPTESQNLTNRLEPSCQMSY
jgi:hypothetical protein